MKFTLGSFSISNEPTLKTFGLEQAEAAMNYTKDPTEAMGIIVHVLGYKNTVAEGIAAADDEQRVAIGISRGAISHREKTIAELRAQIASFEGEIQVANNRRSQLADVAKVFGGK